MVTREGFYNLVASAFAGMEFPADAARVVYPVGMFIPGSDLSPTKDKTDEIIAGLTKWKPKKEEKKTAAPQKLRIEGKDYAEAVDNVNRLFLKNMWSDGLPITPPTEERVEWILTGTDLPRNKEIAKVLPRGGSATVEIIAVNLAMAGGRPEYLPVVIAALEAITQPHLLHQRFTTTTCSVYPAVVVNGPMAKQIRLSSGYGCLGPDPLHPAGASIGRAIRFLLQDAGGAVPGIGTMSIFGGPARYTNIVFAEDEEGLPADWGPLCAEQGYGRGSNVVTTYVAAGTSNIIGGDVGDKESGLECLNVMAGCIGIPNGNYWITCYNPDGAAGIMLIARGTAQGLSKFGWNKEQTRAYLWEHSKVPLVKLPSRLRRIPNQDPAPISMSPKGIKIVVAGGLQSGHMMWFQVGCCPERVTSAEIRLPAGWDKLIRNAEDDLGPMPQK